MCASTNTIILTRALTGEPVEVNTWDMRQQRPYPHETTFQDYGLYARAFQKGDANNSIYWPIDIKTNDAAIITLRNGEKIIVLHPPDEINRAIERHQINIHMHQALKERFLNRIDAACDQMETPYVSESYGVLNTARIIGQPAFSLVRRTRSQLRYAIENDFPLGSGKLPRGLQIIMSGKRENVLPFPKPVLDPPPVKKSPIPFKRPLPKPK